MAQFFTAPGEEACKIKEHIVNIPEIHSGTAALTVQYQWKVIEILESIEWAGKDAENAFTFASGSCDLKCSRGSYGDKGEVFFSLNSSKLSVGDDPQKYLVECPWYWGVYLINDFSYDPPDTWYNDKIDKRTDFYYTLSKDTTYYFETVLAARAKYVPVDLTISCRNVKIRECIW